MPPMDCVTVRRLWRRWIDGSLSAERAASVADHLRVCPSCAERWRQLDPVGALGAFGPPAQAPPGLAGAVLAALPSQPMPSTAGVPLGPAVLAAVLLVALWWERLRFAAWLAPLAGAGLAGMGSALGALAGGLARAVPAAIGVLVWGVPVLLVLVAVEFPVCVRLLRPRPWPR